MNLQITVENKKSRFVAVLLMKLSDVALNFVGIVGIHVNCAIMVKLNI